MGLSRIILVLPLIVINLAFAQTRPRPAQPSAEFTSTGSIRGRVLLPDGNPINEAVKVTLQVLRGELSMTYTDQQGQFEFTGVAQGQYVLEVEADRERRFEVATERVQVFRQASTPVTIYLREKKSDEQKLSAKTISVAESEQKVPGAAKKEFDRASRAAREGRTQDAIAYLKKAVAIYPDYLMAHNDLGAQLLEQGSLDEAEQELRAALRIDPKAFNPQLNLGIVLVRQHNFAEALAMLDKALSVGPDSPAAHLYAGMASSGLDSFERAEKEFKAAHSLGGKPYAEALFHLGQLYMTKGEREMALNSFETYLREVPNATNAPQVHKLIGMLR